MKDVHSATHSGTHVGDAADALRRVEEMGAGDYVRQLVADAPPVSMETKAEIAAIFQG